MRWTVQQAAVKRHTEEEAGLAYLSVVLAERPGDGTAPGRYLEFQRALDDNEREEGYCLLDAAPPGYDGDPVGLALDVASHKTVYGGVRKYRLHDGVLTLRLSWRARRTFRWSRTLRLNLNVPAEQRYALPAALAEVFAYAPPGERPPRVFR
jgi:hypothetical protein